MKVVVDAELCVGCGLCVDSCPEVFQMDDDKAVPVGDSVAVEQEECANKMIADCPVEAIKAE